MLKVQLIVLKVHGCVKKAAKRGIKYVCVALALQIKVSYKEYNNFKNSIFAARYFCNYCNM